MGDDAQGVDAFLTPFLVKTQKSHFLRRGDEAPRKTGGNPESRLVGMKDRGDDRKPPDALDEGTEPAGEETAGLEDGPFAHDRFEEIGTELADPVRGDGLILVEVNQGGLEPVTVLGGSRHSLGSGGGDLLPAGRAAHFGQTVFGDVETGFRRSNTWRASYSEAGIPERSAPQEQEDTGTSTVRSGPVTARSVSPSWPGCPPDLFPEGVRRLLAAGFR